MIHEIFNHMLLFTRFDSKQKGLFERQSNTDQVQDSGLDPDQTKWSRSRPIDFSSLDPSIVFIVDLGCYLHCLTCKEENKDNETTTNFEFSLISETCKST